VGSNERLSTPNIRKVSSDQNNFFAGRSISQLPICATLWDSLKRFLYFSSASSACLRIVISRAKAAWYSLPSNVKKSIEISTGKILPLLVLCCVSILYDFNSRVLFQWFCHNSFLKWGSILKMVKPKSSSSRVFEISACQYVCVNYFCVISNPK
jgi:hypothetical protein